MFYHGTSEANHKSIMNNGFNILLNDKNRWGKAIYLTDNLETANCFGDNVIKVSINSPVLKIDYESLKEVFPYLSIEEEEGTPELKEYILNNTSYKVVSITYKDGENEIVVYDQDIITIQ